MQSPRLKTFSVVVGSGIFGAFVGAAYLLLLLGPRSGLTSLGMTGLVALTGIATPFTILGSAVLTIVHAALARRGRPALARALLLVVGPLLGAAMLIGFIGSFDVPFFLWNVSLIGAGFGLLTTIWWLLLNFVVRRA